MARKAIAKVEETQNPIATYENMEELGSLGFSEVTSEDLAIPFLRILAALSPEVNKRDGKHIEGAEAGMVFNTVLNEVYDGEAGIDVIPAYYNRRFIEWIPRESGKGGYAGSYSPADPIVKTTVKNDRGQDILPNGNTLVNTAQFFVLLLHPTEGPQRALIPMASTQLKKAKKWLSQMQSLTASGKNGPFVLPMMSQVYRMVTVEERNDKGSWFGWEVSRNRTLDLSEANDKAAFDAAVGFARGVKAGEVEVKPEGAESSEPTPTQQDDSVPF